MVWGSKCLTITSARMDWIAGRALGARPARQVRQTEQFVQQLLAVLQLLLQLLDDGGDLVDREPRNDALQAALFRQ